MIDIAFNFYSNFECPLHDSYVEKKAYLDKEYNTAGICQACLCLEHILKAYLQVSDVWQSYNC